MSSSNRRERDLARAKRERQLQRAAASQRTFNPLLIVAVLAVMVVGYVVFSGGGDSNSADPTPTQSTTASASSTSDCTVAPQANMSPAQWSDAPAQTFSGDVATWTLTTNCGDVVIELDGKNAPVTVNSMKFLTEQGYYNNTPCHRLTTAGLYVLQCGDPTGTGGGGPGYSFVDENLPANEANNYPAGTVAMANSGPNTNGSQFFIVFADTQLGPNYTIFGRVTSGLDIIEKVALAGVSGGASDGAPAQPIGILSANFTA
jgi:peptidyl-prolyl cis-trans isomerase B (cyclophilin B)